MTAARTGDPKVVKIKPKPASGGGWQDRLILTENGTPKACLANAITALRYAPEWDGVLWHDEFAVRTFARRPPPWVLPSMEFHDSEWEGHDDIRLAEWLQHQGIAVNPMVAGQAVEVASRNFPFHPVREYLDSLEWDGVIRLPYWLRDYLGVADTKYSRAVGCRWLVSAVARIYQPGCKADCVLILEGPQGLKKSTALSKLGGPWFTDQIADLGNKDSCVDVQGAWIIELAELDSMSRGEVGRIKAFMSRPADRFRMPYDRRNSRFPRQCVFAGTVNPEGSGYLKDPTGGRRFWPVECSSIDIEGLERDVHQLWAEAVYLYRARHPWWLDTPELEQAAELQQRARYAGDSWEGPIAEFLSDKTSVSVSQILEYGLCIEKSRWDQRMQNRVARVLTSMKWKQRRSRRGDTVVRLYWKPEPVDRSHAADRTQTADRTQQKPQNSAVFGAGGVNSMSDRTQECSHENSSVYAGFEASVNSVNGVNSISVKYGRGEPDTADSGGTADGGGTAETGVPSYECKAETVHTVHTVHSADKPLMNKGVFCEQSGVNSMSDCTQHRSQAADRTHDADRSQADEAGGGNRDGTA